MKTSITNKFDLATRSEHIKVDCELTITIDGREIPNLAVLGSSLENAIETIKKSVSDSYKVVPERIGT